MRRIIRPFSLLIALSLIALALAAETDSRSGAEPNSFGAQDGRFIKKLEWDGPPGTYPNTYADYLERHPLTAAEFEAVKSDRCRLDANVFAAG